MQLDRIEIAGIKSIRELKDLELIFAEETCWLFQDAWTLEYNESPVSGHQESELSRVAQQRPGSVADHVLRSLKSWRFYHFHDTSESAPIEDIRDINDNLYLRNDARTLMSSAAARSQIIVATQSVTLVNQFEPEDLIIVGRKEQETVMERPDTRRLSGWLEEYALGELWEKNVLGGRPSR